MKHTSLFFAIAIAFLAVAAPSGAKDIQLPADGVQLIPSSLPGYAKAQANCTMCHSAEYMAYQPPNAARPYWNAMVHRMKDVFAAPVDEADIPAIVDYLTATYGNRQQPVIAPAGAGSSTAH